ncbi:hypothetical protein ABES25_06125 [Bacillus gobiensis]|uniref:hypothetical protein n=1 Tax=Bacillus gobiensis TaxID=1441095 RepID=UPI003D239299
MEIQQLEEKLKDLNNYIPSFKSLRVEVAYWDVLSTSSLYIEIKKYIEENNLAVNKYPDLYASGDIKQINYSVVRHRQIVSLMKSLFIYTDIFVNIFLQEITQIKKEQYSTKGLIRSFYKSNKNTLSQDVIQPIFCTVIYRDKMIVHHDVPRLSAYSIERLSPQPENLSLEDKVKEELENYKKKYKDIIPSEETNDIMILRKLFYNVPFVDKKREDIDKLIESVGCESITPEELMGYLYSFIDTVINTVTMDKQEA